MLIISLIIIILIIAFGVTQRLKYLKNKKDSKSIKKTTLLLLIVLSIPALYFIYESLSEHLTYIENQNSKFGKNYNLKRKNTASATIEDYMFCQGQSSTMEVWINKEEYNHMIGIGYHSAKTIRIQNDSILREKDIYKIKNKLGETQSIAISSYSTPTYSKNTNNYYFNSNGEKIDSLSKNKTDSILKNWSIK